MADNIKELPDDESSLKKMESQMQQQAQGAPQEPAPTPVQELPQLMTLREAATAVTVHYGRGFKKLKTTFQKQITDGSVCEFLDMEMGGTVVATARVRFANNILLDEQSGEFYLQVLLSDISFAGRQFDLTTTYNV